VEPGEALTRRRPLEMGTAVGRFAEVEGVALEASAQFRRPQSTTAERVERAELPRTLRAAEAARQERAQRVARRVALPAAMVRMVMPRTLELEAVEAVKGVEADALVGRAETVDFPVGAVEGVVATTAQTVRRQVAMLEMEWS
jgi:hypothetical protein